MKVYLVGGAVRDQLLNKQVYERDYVVVGARPEELIAKGFRQVGKDFPVFLHPHTGEEYALARTERKSGPGYTGFTVFAGPEVTLEDDLVRRDLTVNAIAQDEHGQLIDPYNGRADIEQRILRHISPAFTEDPLRVLRVARFAARFAQDGFSIAPETIALMQQMCQNNELQYLSAERVWRETEKALTTASPQVYWQVLQQVHAMQPWFSELEHALDLQYFSQFSRVPESERSLYAWALSCYNLSTIQLKSLQQRLRVPNKYKDVTEAAARIAWTPTQPIDVDWIVSMVGELDGWRQPQRVNRMLTLWQLLGMTQATGTAIQMAVQAAQQVNPNELIAAAAQAGTPLRGAEIKEAVLAERRQRIQQQWQ